MSKQFGNRLKELRLESGLTQQEIAKLLNTGKASISHYESNRRFPDLSVIKFLADYFNVSTDYLLGKSDIKNPYSSFEDDFLNKAEKEHGYNGKKQAESILNRAKALFDGGNLPEEDKDEFFRAMTEIYFESKQSNKKYTPNKYKKNDN